MSTVSAQMTLSVSRPRAKIRPNFPRSRNGCLTCRKRKKKCDEISPLCTNCAGKGLECKWPAGRKSNERIATISTEESPAESTSLSPTARYSGDACPVESDITADYSVDSSAPGIMWNPMLNSFMAPDRACSTSPVSIRFLEHYLSRTGVMLAMVPPSKSPFITSLVPTAYMDDLLMHAMLAVSGAHLSFKQPENDEVIQATMSHYNAVIRNIRQEIGQPDLQNDTVKTARLLLVLIMLCHYEVLSGNTAVNLFQHLRACRQLILWQLPKDGTSSNDLLGFAIELYSYIVTSNTFSPYGTMQIRTLPNDPFITSLNSTIGSCSTFGAMLGGAHALFELIPQVSVFHGQRLAEEAQGLQQLSPHLEAQHSFLKASIDNWTFPSPSNDPDTLERKKTAEIIRRALRIYLSTAACGSVVDSPSIICAVQDEVDAVISISNNISEPQYMSTLLWPLVITASCMVKECQRKETAETLPKSHYEMTHISVAVELLEKLWKDQDRRAYGPYGLYFIMEKYGIQFSTI